MKYTQMKIKFIQLYQRVKLLLDAIVKCAFWVQTWKEKK